MEAAVDPIGYAVARMRGDRPWLPAAVFVATIFHAGVGISAERWHRELPPSPRGEVTTTFELEPVEPTPPVAAPIAPETPPAAAEGGPRTPRALKSTPLPAPVAAAPVLTKVADTNAPVDLTGTSFVVGSAANEAGGETSANGAGLAPAHGPVGMNGSVRSPSASSFPASGRSSVDHSRPAAVLGEAHWNCPFPTEADADQIDDATVTIRVELDASGAVRRVAPIVDPGHGFAREAQRCATQKHWVPALDRAGAPIEGTVTIRVRFDR
jgi:periplasmic protein TonB